MVPIIIDVSATTRSVGVVGVMSPKLRAIISSTFYEKRFHFHLISFELQTKRVSSTCTIMLRQIKKFAHTSFYHTLKWKVFFLCLFSKNKKKFKDGRKKEKKIWRWKFCESDGNLKNVEPTFSYHCSKETSAYWRFENFCLIKRSWNLGGKFHKILTTQWAVSDKKFPHSWTTPQVNTEVAIL